MYEIFSRGLLGSNTYVLFDEPSREAMIIDCGNPVRNISAFCTEKSLEVRYILLTHSHCDHADYLPEYREAFPSAAVLCHEREVVLMNDPEANVSAYLAEPRRYGYPDRTVKEGDLLTLGGTPCRILSTPGHTPGSICLYLEEEGIVFSGDTLFAGSYGRCDFKYGSEADMLASLRRLYALPPSTVFLPGHGGSTTAAREAEWSY